MPTRSRIVTGLHEAIAHAKGATHGRTTTVHVPNEVDVRAIRRRLGLSQEEFALQFGFSLGTLRHWEQGQRHPEGAARVLLKVIDRRPDAVREALAS
jgi:putative transcriptional regulator